MITFEEALQIAAEKNGAFDTVQEYSDAFVFFINDGVIRYGGAEAGCVIEKRTGNKLRWNEYFMDDKRNIVPIGIPRSLR